MQLAPPTLVPSIRRVNDPMVAERGPIPWLRRDAFVPIVHSSTHLLLPRPADDSATNSPRTAAMEEEEGDVKDVMAEPAVAASQDEIANHFLNELFHIDSDKDMAVKEEEDDWSRINAKIEYRLLNEPSSSQVSISDGSSILSQDPMTDPDQAEEGAYQMQEDATAVVSISSRDLEQTKQDAKAEALPVSAPSNELAKKPRKGRYPRAAESGNSGRWTAEEHDHFLAASRLYGRRWKKISKTLVSRTPVQVRTHALKYYARLAKMKKMGEVDAITDRAEATAREEGPVAASIEAEMVVRDDNAGRWTAGEHHRFLIAVLRHGKNWKEIAASVGTRSHVQVRTHAQKYYARLAKARRGAPSVAAAATISAPPPARVAAPKQPKEPRVDEADVKTGRWTMEEHRLFLTAALEHGKDWKKISLCVKTRTAVQVRTHAQKYLQRWMRQKLRAMA